MAIRVGASINIGGSYLEGPRRQALIPGILVCRGLRLPRATEFWIQVARLGQGVVARSGWAQIGMACEGDYIVN